MPTNSPHIPATPHKPAPSRETQLGSSVGAVAFRPAARGEACAGGAGHEPRVSRIVAGEFDRLIVAIRHPSQGFVGCRAGRLNLRQPFPASALQGEPLQTWPDGLREALEPLELAVDGRDRRRRVPRFGRSFAILPDGFAGAQIRKLLHRPHFETGVRARDRGHIVVDRLRKVAQLRPRLRQSDSQRRGAVPFPAFRLLLDALDPDSLVRVVTLQADVQVSADPLSGFDRFEDRVELMVAYSGWAVQRNDAQPIVRVPIALYA